MNENDRMFIAFIAWGLMTFVFGVLWGRFIKEKR